MADDNPNPEHPAGLPATPSEAPPPKPYRVRHDGWTVQRQNDFMEALGRTGCVRDAARVAGISWNSAYKFRERDADFAERWERALRRAKTPLEEVAWKRAPNTHWVGGEAECLVSRQGRGAAHQICQ